MSSASDRRKSGGEGGGGEGANWMDTYGDLVTLLLTFFVLLFANSSVNAEKWQALVGAFTGTTVTVIQPLTPELVAENPIPQIGSITPAEDEPDPTDPNDITKSKADENLEELYESMLAYVGENNIDAEIVLIAEDYMIVMRFNDQVFFKSGDAALLPESVPILNHVIEMFAEYGHLYRRLSIEGHTDNVPIKNGKYPSNWELSADRALNVQKYIMATGLIDPMRIKIGAYGEYSPVASNDTAEGRAKNRRVDFILEGMRPS